MTNYFEQFLEVYKQTTFEFGVADIFTDDSVDVGERVGSFILLMNQATLGKGGDHIHGVLVIAPPLDSKLGCDQTEIEKTTRSATEALFKRSISEEEQGSLSRFVRVVHTSNFRVSSVVETLKSAQEKSAAIVLYAALYRMENQEEIPPLPFPPLPDDVWVPHLCDLAARSAALAKSQNFYLLLDTGEPSPQRQENYEQLKNLNECGLFSMQRAHDSGKLISEHIASWRSLAESGRLGSVFASIDNLPAWMDSHKSFLKLQLMESVVPSEEILRLLRKEESNIRSKADHRAKLKLARIAERSNDDRLSLELLSSAVDGLRSSEDFLLAAELAGNLGEFELVEKILERAASLFPDSPSFLDQRLRLYLRTRRYSELVKRLLDSSTSIDPRRRFFFLTLGSAFSSEDPVNFILLFETITSITPEFNSWCQVVCGNEAIIRQEFVQAIQLCMPAEGRPLSDGVANTLIVALKHRLLQRAPDGRTLAINGDELIPPVQAVITYLSENPGDARTRQRLTTLLSVETSGLLGFAVLVAITMRFNTQIRIEAQTTHPQSQDIKDPEGCLAAMEEIMKWAANESPLVPGRSEVPKELLTAPPDDIFWLVKNTLKYKSDLRIKAEEETFDKILTIGLLIAPQTAEPDQDLSLLQYAGARYTAVNKAQRARDLAEQALQTAANIAARNRRAWVVFSDIYHRAHSFNEALLGIACAFSIDMPVDTEQLYHEGTLLIRIYRDTGFAAEAMRFADYLLSLCSELGLHKVYSQRIETLVLQIRTLEVLRHPEDLKSELPRLVQDAAQHCIDLVEEGEEITPAVTVLAQCVQQAMAAGIEVNSQISSLLEAQLSKIPLSAAELLKLLDPTAITGSQLLKLASSIQAARNAEDIAFDLMTLAIASRRFLDSTMDDGDTTAAAFALEALTDHALEGAPIGTDRSPFREIGRSFAMAKELSLQGMDIVLLGLSEKGRLVRLNMASGIAELVKEAEAVFSGEKFRMWTEKYPYDYVHVKDPMNLFYQTLTGIGVSFAPQRPTLLIMDNSLQQMPPNLIMAGDDFAGRHNPMAAAPSLSWVCDMSSRLFPATKSVAWISTEYAEDKNPALITVADRLQETFEKYGIPLHTSASVPADLAESDLAIIAAHGSILPEGRYVQRISDDAELALYPVALANAVRQSAVVVLFICSGGRLDTHPVAETTVGLVRQLLDHGCATVIASPWPLDTRVPSHWLPTFLERWTAGDSAVVAAFAANQNVMRAMGDSPLDSLAMNVFGDPLRRKPA